MSRATELTATRLDGPVLTAGRRRFLYFWLPPQRWSFRSQNEREQLINNAAGRYGQLVGRRLHVRVTTRPYAVEEWARALDENTPRPLPDWNDHLRSEQAHVVGLTLADKQVFLGVELHEPKIRRHSAESEIRSLEGIIGGAGINGRAVTPGELEWLIHRSVALGADAPDEQSPPRREWEDTDLAAFTDRADWTCKPYDRSTRIVADVNGQQTVRHVVTVTLSRMSTLSIPERMGPWMQRSDRLFPVEWSLIADVVEPEKVKRRVRDTMLRIQSQIEHYAEHKLNPPLSLPRQNELVLKVEDDISSGDTLSVRFDTWVRAAVSGATEDEALDKAKRLSDLYEPAMSFTRTAAQYAVAREFIPGEPLSSVAHRRRLPAPTFAAALPTVTAMIGDRVGPHIGKTVGSSERAVCWDTHRSMEVRERSGLTIIAGGLGAGKSTLVGALAYQAVRRGIPTILLDPSGPLARLAGLPELADRSRAVDLMQAESGALSPFRVIDDPRRSHYDTDDEFQRQWVMMQARRRALCMDVLMMLLPAGVARMPETRKVLKRASREVGGARTASVRSVIRSLHDDTGSSAEHSAYVAEELEDIADMPQARLIFHDAERLPGIGEDDFLFQVLTMRGNVLPKPDSDPDDWSIEERLGVPLLHLASHLTAQHVYSRDMNERKMIAMDELHDLTRVGSGRALINRITRDSRKWNLRALLASQNVDDVTTAGIENFVDSVFGGRTVDFAAQQSLLRVLGVERNVGYEAVLGGLSPIERLTSARSGFRDFVFNDGDDGVEVIRVHVPSRLQTVLDTTADPSKARHLVTA